MITKILRKAIMKRSYLEKVYFKKRAPDSLIHLKKQKNYCSRLYRKQRRKYFESISKEGSVTIKVFGKIWERSAIR